MATVSSITPSPTPRWPPVTETASIVSRRSSSASCLSSSMERSRMSRGSFTRSKSGVLLCSVKSPSTMPCALRQTAQVPPKVRPFRQKYQGKKRRVPPAYVPRVEPSQYLDGIQMSLCRVLRLFSPSCLLPLPFLQHPRDRQQFEMPNPGLVHKITMIYETYQMLCPKWRSLRRKNRRVLRSSCAGGARSHPGKAGGFPRRDRTSARRPCPSHLPHGRVPPRGRPARPDPRGLRRRRAPRTPASETHRPRGSPSLRRTRCGRSAGLGEGRHRPLQAD